MISLTGLALVGFIAFAAILALVVTIISAKKGGDE